MKSAIKKAFKYIYNNWLSDKQQVALFKLTGQQMFVHINYLKQLGYNPDVVIDIGAYKGKWTFFVKKIFPSATFLMIEPQKYCMCFLLIGLWCVLSVTTLQAQPLREVFRRVTSSVVVIHAKKKQVIANSEAQLPDQSIGSGFLISEDGKVLTAAHVIQLSDQIEVEFLGGYLAVLA